MHVVDVHYLHYHEVGHRLPNHGVDQDLRPQPSMWAAKMVHRCMAQSTVHPTSVSIYDKEMKVNARGTSLGCKNATAQMMKQGLHPREDRGSSLC